MDDISLKSFRCFRHEQTVRLAPLTFLVGENSTGKTSFMAAIRSLWDAAYSQEQLDFKENPYDLGSFDEIVHYRGGRGGRAATFELAFTTREQIGGNRRKRRPRQRNDGVSPYRVSIEFKERGRAPAIARRRNAMGNTWVEYNAISDEDHHIDFGVRNMSWRLRSEEDDGGFLGLRGATIFPFHLTQCFLRGFSEGRSLGLECVSLHDSAAPGEDDWNRVLSLAEVQGLVAGNAARRPYASAPLRSKPRRTYDPARPVYDPEGDYIPMLLANMQYQTPGRWDTLKVALEEFGRTAGLFDELSIRNLGKRGSDPFQVHVRKLGKSAKGPRRNLIDVGYGVSQILPLLTELLRAGGPNMFLLQQPEVHLHPSAQAALGSLFCRIAGPERKLIVETHSDHLLDRVRMDVRDGITHVKPDDVSVLFFERKDLHVIIHSLQLDRQGNVLNAPPGYRQFFMEETKRDLGF